MTKFKRKILLYILSAGSLVSWANDTQPTDTLTVEIYYRQGISRFDSTYQDNRNRMGKLLEFLYTLSADSTYRLNRLHITSGASPEGNTSFNKVLSKKEPMPSAITSVYDCLPNNRLWLRKLTEASTGQLCKPK